MEAVGGMVRIFSGIAHLYYEGMAHQLKLASFKSIEGQKYLPWTQMFFFPFCY